MISRPYQIVRRTLPLLMYCGHAARDERLDQPTRALMVTLGRDVLDRVDRTIAALIPDHERDVAVVRDIERARRRLRAIDAGEVTHG